MSLVEGHNGDEINRNAPDTNATVLVLLVRIRTRALCVGKKTLEINGVKVFMRRSVRE